jgi:hypothetical protein
MYRNRTVLLVFSCCVLLPLSFASAAGSAVPVFDPYGGVVIENDSNLFAVPSNAPVKDPHGVPRLSDTFETYRAGVNINYLFGRQQAYATFEGRELQYDHFTNLDHSEYLVKLGLDWKLASRFDGIFDVRREKKIIAFADANLTQLEVQTDQLVEGTFNFALTPEWRLETQGNLHTLNYPIAASPDFRLHEGVEGVGIKYLGIANLAYGIEASHVDGTYQGVPGSSGYKQNTYQLAAKYTVTSVTRFNGAVGYTDRTIQGVSSTVSGVTGLFGYERQITGKTSVNLKIERAVNSYYTAVGSEIDTGGTALVNWQATPKIALALSYQRVRSAFQGDSLQSSLTLGRKDNASNSGLEVKYRPLRILLIRPYVRRQVRSSTIAQFSYNDTQLGVEFVFGRDEPVH